VHPELWLGLGLRCGRKRIGRLMRTAGLVGVGYRRKRRRKVAPAVHDDLVGRRFVADTPDRLWCTDIAEHPTGEGEIYCAAVLDVFTRRIVGWSIADHMRPELVVDALEMTRWQRRQLWPAGRVPSKRTLARAVTKATKSRAGRRRIGLPAQLVRVLIRHRGEESAERAMALQLWREDGWVFTSPTGEPVNPSTDYHQWKALVRRAGVRDARLHDARHSAATVLLVLGVPERTVMSDYGVVHHGDGGAVSAPHRSDPSQRR
jgi:integrase